MKIAIFSDTHGNIAGMQQAVREQQPDMVLHLGDHITDAERLKRSFPAMDIRCVKGNCDYGCSGETVLQFSADGVEILMTHGHIYQVKMTMDKLKNAAWFTGARLVLFGHTHEAGYEEDSGIHFLNPGSAGTGLRPTFALAELENGAVHCRILPIPVE